MDKLEKVKGLIESKELTVGVIGLGYVGLPLAVEYAKKDYRTFGFDIDLNKINSLRNKVNYIDDIDDSLVEDVIDKSKLLPTNDFSKLTECDAIFICVPTPFTENKDPDISFVLNASEEIAKYLRQDQIIILKSTTFPGTTEKYVQPILNKAGLNIGEEYFLAFSPERIDPGNKIWNTGNTPIVLGGINELSTTIGKLVHGVVVGEVVAVASPSIAEMEKLLENIFRSVNIALVNELARLCDRIGVNIWDVVNAAATKPFGFMPFYPGPGIGGHCILIDPYYLEWMAREHDFVTKFIKLAAEINEDMPFYVRDMVIKQIAKQPIALKDAKILILGVAFKKDVDDLRHSPALKVAELIIKEGINNIDYFDPYIPSINIFDKEYLSLKALNEKLLSKYDVALITTDHSVFDFQMIVNNSKVVVDTRNACKGIKADNVILLGSGK